MKARDMGTERSLKFTLIELLTVAAIVAVLAALLLPALKAARESCGKIVCMGNLRQWGIGLHEYRGDFNDCVPRGMEGPSLWWWRVLGPYAGCPVKAYGWGVAPGSIGRCPQDRHNANGETYGSYGWNAYAFGYLYSVSPTEFRVRGASVAPDTVVSGDSDSSWSLSGSALPSPPLSLYWIRLNHVGNSGSFLFFDGHVESKTAKGLSKGIFTLQID